MKRSFWSLVAVQIQVLLNDNAAKLMLIALGISVAGEIFPHNTHSAETTAKIIKTTLAAIIILPFILFAPSAGWVADRFSKRNVVVLTLWAQFAIMVFIGMALAAHSMTLCTVGLFLLGIQCAFFSPAKQGIIKEIVTATKISSAVGVVEVTAISSMLIGGLAGGSIYDYCFGTIHAHWPTPYDHWRGAELTMVVLTVLALISLLIGYQIEPTPSHTNQPFRAGLLWEHFGQLKDVWRDQPVRLCALGISYFYGLAGALYLTLIEVANSIHGGSAGTASHAGIFAATLGAGIVFGSLLVTRMTTHQVEIGLIPIGSCGLILSAVAAAAVKPYTGWFLLALFSLGIAGALFVVPLNAHLQEQVEPERRGRILSGNLLMSNLVGIVAVIIQLIVSAIFEVSARHQLFLYAVPTAFLTLYIIFLVPEGLLRLALGLIARTFYRVTAVNVEALPAKGGVLLLPNHISYIDAVILQLACPRPIRFLVYDQIYKARFLHWGLRLLGAIPISPKTARTAIETAVNALARGEVVCLFPEGALTRTATLQKLNRGYELIARKARVPVMPVWLENVWGSIFSYYGGQFFWKWPRVIPLHVWIYFGKTLNPSEATSERVRRELYDLSEKGFQDRPELKSHLAYECVRGLRKRFLSTVYIDAAAGDRHLTGGELLAVGITLAQWLRKNVPEKRVGIVLPTSIGAAVANLGVILAGKIPVNLNFTAGRAANESAMARAGIQRLITAPAVMEKIPDFPWIENRIDIAELIKSFPKQTLKRWWLRARLMPLGMLRRKLKIPETGDREEAALLFTSGSSGEPKAVVLTHRNVLSNVAQIGAILGRVHLESILGSLPVFHSFGFTVTLWWPLLGGPRVATYPNPLDAVKLVETIERHKLQLLITTPTFLRAFLRKAKPEQLRSLKMIVTGAEKLPLDLMREFEAKFGVQVSEGYGMTEASPVVACNLFDDPPSKINPDGVLGRRVGSVGRMVPGLTARIRDTETDEDLGIFQSGMLWLRGANVFEGYYKDTDQTTAVLKDGWYRTGDVGRLDEDGFLFIEGRISRFSKIGGEMVPHMTLENKITEALDLHPAAGEGPPIAVVGIPDEKKGESLVLLSTIKIDLAALRKKLLENGVAALWIPKVVAPVPAVPILASGKLDMRECLRLAKEAAAPVETSVAP